MNRITASISSCVPNLPNDARYEALMLRRLHLLGDFCSRKRGRIGRLSRAISLFVLLIPMQHLFCWILYSLFLFSCSCQSADGPWRIHIIDNTSSGADGTKLIDVNGDGYLEIVSGWEQGHVARMYINPGKVRDYWDYVEVPAPHVEDALPIDLDQDGWVDLVTCSEGDHMRVSFHWGPTEMASYLHSGSWQSEDVPCTIGKTRWMFAQPMQVDGKNGIDLVLGSKDPNGSLGWLECPNDPRELAAWQYHEISPANWIMSIVIRDIDGDGWQDILVSDRNGPNRGVRWLKHPGADSLAQIQHWTSIPIGMRDADPLFLDVADSDKNGRIELWVPNLSEYFMYFEQIDASGINWKSERWIIPEMGGLIGKSSAIGDINQDGLPDLVTTYDGATERSGVLWSSYDSAQHQWTHHDVSGPEGIKYDFAILIDMDWDGDLDILTSEEANNSQRGPGLGVIWYENPIQSPKR